MDARHPHSANGHRTRFMPQGPDSIIIHLLETQRLHTAEIARLTTQITNMQRRRRKRPVFPWKDVMPYLWGGITLLLAAVAPQTVELAVKLLSLARG